MWSFYEFSVFFVIYTYTNYIRTPYWNISEYNCMSAELRVFSPMRRLFHWTIAALLAVQIPLALFMVEQQVGLAKSNNYSIHKYIGLSLFALGALRLIWSLLTSRPPLPDGTRKIEMLLSRLIQIALYLLVLLIPITGWLMNSAAGIPVNVFDLFVLPDLVDESEQAFETFRRIHWGQSNALFVVMALHFLGAMRHYFFLRDNVLYSMLPLKNFERKS